MAKKKARKQLKPKIRNPRYADATPEQVAMALLYSKSKDSEADDKEPELESCQSSI